MKWLVGFLVVVAALACLFWYAVLDSTTPANADSEFDLAAYRTLVANDATATLPTEVRMVTAGRSQAPSFAAQAGDFSGSRTFSYNTFEVAGPGGATLIDAAVDADALATMTQGKGVFDAGAYQSILDEMKRAARIVITHEHVDHVMAVARHPDPDAIAAHLVLTRAQLDGLPKHAPNGVLAASIAAVTPLDLATPQRIAPGIVAASAPGHSPGSVVFYVRTTSHEYLFVGDIAWANGAIDALHGRPRFIPWIMSGVDPDRPRVLRQLRALHDMRAANPDLVIVVAHDEAYLHRLIETGTLQEGFAP